MECAVTTSNTNRLVGRETVPFAKIPSMAEYSVRDAHSPEAETGAAPKQSLFSRLEMLGFSGILFAALQSACTAVIAISSIRVALGLSALAAAAGIHHPARGFHQDAIRIPMMIFALVGSVLNLLVIWKIRSLRIKPAAEWRQKPITKSKLISERFQIAISILTLILLAAEWITHPIVHPIP
jgi:hypothetical protein